MHPAHLLDETSKVLQNMEGTEPLLCVQMHFDDGSIRTLYNSRMQ